MGIHTRRPYGIRLDRRQQQEEIPIPSHVKAQLREEADHEGGVQIRSNVVRVGHDLDTGDTDRQIRGGGALESAQNGRGQGGQLDHRSQQVLNRFLESQAERALKRHHRRGSRDKGIDKNQPDKMPSIEVTALEKPGGGRSTGAF